MQTDGVHIHIIIGAEAQQGKRQLRLLITNGSSDESARKVTRKDIYYLSFTVSFFFFGLHHFLIQGTDKLTHPDTFY